MNSNKRFTLEPQIYLLFWLVLSFLSNGLAQEQQPLSIPVDPATAALSVDSHHMRSDGSQFVLLVRLAGSPSIKYLASREDVVRALAQQLELLNRDRELDDQKTANLSTENQAREKQVQELQQSKQQMLQALSLAQTSEKQLKSKIKTPGGSSPPGGSGGSQGPDTKPANAAPNPGEPATIQNSASAEVEDIVSQEPPASTTLLSLPIPDDAALQIRPGSVRPDGSQFVLLVTTGGILLRYVATREDVVLEQHNQLQLLISRHELERKRQENLVAQNQLLDQEATSLAADIGDLQRAVQLTNQNTETLREVLKAQKRSVWEQIVGIIPSIAAIIAVAVK